LKHLKNVECEKSSEEEKEVFTFKFTFSENEFFSNDVLTKKMIMADDE